MATEGLDVLSGDPVFQRHACPTGAADIGPAITAVASEPFAYEPATDTYAYTWKTQKSLGRLVWHVDRGPRRRPVLRPGGPLHEVIL